LPIFGAFFIKKLRPTSCFAASWAFTGSPYRKSVYHSLQIQRPKKVQKGPEISNKSLL